MLGVNVVWLLSSDGSLAFRCEQLRDVFDLVPAATIQELIIKYPNPKDLKALFAALDSLQKGMLWCT